MITDLFKAHSGPIYIYSGSEAIRRRLLKDLTEQGFLLGNGEPVREVQDLMSVHIDRTVSYCGYVCRVQCGSLRHPEYVEEDRKRGCTRVDYARFSAGLRDYVIKGQ